MPDDILKPGTGYAQCAGCGAYFGSVTSFNRYRVGDWDHRRCLTPAELAGLGLTRDERGIWRRAFTGPGAPRVARGVGQFATKGTGGED
jgi:hypothetical protein